MKVLIIGGVAAGTKTAAKLKREDRSIEVTVLTKDQDISYAGCGLPYYVVGKDVQQNIVYVSRNLNAPDLWTQTLPLEDVLWRPTLPPTTLLGADGALQVRLRHRAPLLPAKLQGNQLYFAQPVKRPAPGQSAVFYRDGECLGGGVVAE